MTRRQGHISVPVKQLYNKDSRVEQIGKRKAKRSLSSVDANEICKNNYISKLNDEIAETVKRITTPCKKYNTQHQRVAKKPTAFRNDNCG